MKIKSMILIGIVVIITLISTQNMQEITLKILLWDISFPMIFLIFGSAIPGFIIGFLYATISSRRSKRKEKAAQN